MPRRSDPHAARIAWPSGPTSPAVAEVLRALELKVNRRLDGILHGNYQGLTPGHGSEPGEARLYAPGDDVRRIDWNVTARTQETHVREQIADRDLEAWLVVDTSAAMHFGTIRDEKASIALAAAGCVGFLTSRNQNRVGAVLVAGPHLKVIPPRGGRDQVRAILTAIADPPPSEGLGRADLAAALQRVGVICKRRGFAAVIADFVGTDWVDAMRRLGVRHDLLAITVDDPRELDIPPIGLVELVDPATGRQREVHVTAEVQRRYAAAAALRAEDRAAALRSAGADVIALSTDGDWMSTIANHLQHRRRQVLRPKLSLGL
jgi:uncharacterized protein (DUF58 family)